MSTVPLRSNTTDTTRKPNVVCYLISVHKKNTNGGTKLELVPFSNWLRDGRTMGEVGRDVLYLTDTYVGYKVSQSVGAVKVTLQLVFFMTSTVEDWHWKQQGFAFRDQSWEGLKLKNHALHNNNMAYKGGKWVCLEVWNKYSTTVT